MAFLDLLSIFGSTLWCFDLAFGSRDLEGLITLSYQCCINTIFQVLSFVLQYFVKQNIDLPQVLSPIWTWT